ncbi:MAG: NAD(P)/FAD-dependent oxidoreductase [Candidatus Thermoplasmatota archaeon]|nr:NAD(P)/FAD-dependent oxidoreductase [Candidatus Thermoplasmatota archaeon]
MMKDEGKIKILGAGPAGLTAAINLAKRGYNVKVFEKNEDCGMRFRGDFQGLENWSSRSDILDDIKSMNISINFWHKPVFQCEFYDFKLNKRIVRFKRPGLYLVKRGAVKGSLDLSLKEQAIRSGVEIIFKRKVTEKEVNIIAGGPRRIDGIVRGMTFETETEHPPIVILNDDLAPKSFAYLLISEGKGCLGTGLTKNYRMASEYFERALKTFRKIVALDISNAKMFTGYGNFFLMKDYEQNGKIYGGEAAGLQDFLFAFGLRQAITSGYLAAISVIENKSYDKLIKRRFQQQLETSITNRFLFSLMGNRGYSFFLKKSRKIKDPLRGMYKQYNSSFLKKVIFPLARIALRK